MFLALLLCVVVSVLLLSFGIIIMLGLLNRRIKLWSLIVMKLRNPANGKSICLVQLISVRLKI